LKRLRSKYFTKYLVRTYANERFFAHGARKKSLICLGLVGAILRIMYEIKYRIFDEQHGNPALLIKNSGLCFIFNP